MVDKMKQERKTVFDLNIRVTFYARVSTTRDEQENSIENQITYFTDMIKSNPNWEYVEGYADRVRGESAQNRVEFLRMVDDGKAGKFDLILTKEISRFARNTIDSLTYTRELLRAGVGVFFQNDNICTIDTDSELRLTIMSSIATDEVRKLSERIRWGHKRAIESGHVIGNSRIFGYDKDDCKLVINEREAVMVKKIFELYSTGEYSVKKIEKIIYDDGYRGINGTRIHHNTISGIIQNPKYKGFYCGNKVKITDYRTKEQRFLPEEEWVMYKDETGEIVPAIVDEDLWDRCNKIFKERSETVKSRGHSYKSPSVFSGKLRCAVHNVSYWRTSYSNSKQKGNTVYQWICGEKRRFGASSCMSFSIMESDLYRIMEDCAREIARQSSGDFDDFIKPLLSVSNPSSVKKQIADLNSTLLREQTKKDKLLDLYTDGAISKSEFCERNDSINISISEIRAELSSLISQNEDNNIEKYIKSLKSNIDGICLTDDELSNEQVEQFVKELVSSIDVTPINEDTMRLVIKLKVGEDNSADYYKSKNKRDKNYCYLGNITKKMIAKQQYTASRPDRTKANHIHNTCLIVEVVF